MIRVSHGYSLIDMLFFIAESTASGSIPENDHITTIFEASFLPISWRYFRFLFHEPDIFCHIKNHTRDLKRLQ
jgi:hypothetical protein